MIPEPIRVAIVGYGLAGRTFHAPLIQSVEGLRLYRIVSRNVDLIRREVPGVTIEPSFEAALAPDIDLIVLGTPNDTHTSMAKAALEAGKHVLVDKPFTTTASEAAMLVSLAAENKRVISVFQNRRWDSDFLAAKQILAEGLLGEVVHFESHMDRFRPGVLPRWKDEGRPGSGVWYDLGPHLVDQALQLFGEPHAIHSHFASQRPNAQNKDWAHVIFEYDRLRVVLQASTVAAIPGARFTIHGLKGTWTKNYWDPQENQLKAGIRPGDAEYGDDPDLAVFKDGETGKTTELKCPPGDYRHFYVALRDAILANGENPVLPAHAVRVMQILDQSIAAP
jgi:predicted dehydrogenase